MGIFGLFKRNKSDDDKYDITFRCCKDHNIYKTNGGHKIPDADRTGAEHLFFTDCNVAGVSRIQNGIDPATIIQTIPVGTRMFLWPEPENIHDKDAIRVCDDRGRKIGYVPATKYISDGFDFHSILCSYVSHKYDYVCFLKNKGIATRASEELNRNVMWCNIEIHLYSHTDEDGIYQIKRQIEKAEDEARQMQLLEEQREQQRKEAAEKKKQLKMNLPPTSILNKISSEMIGTESEYRKKVREILNGNGINTSDVWDVPTPWPNGMVYKSTSFFGVKLDGKLRYVLLRVPPDEIQCGFYVAPSSMAEGETASRIFISSPSALDQIESYIIKSYNMAVDYQNNVFGA